MSDTGFRKAGCLVFSMNEGGAFWTGSWINILHSRGIHSCDPPVAKQLILSIHKALLASALAS